MDVDVPLYYCNRDPLVIGRKLKVITERMEDENSRLLCTCSVLPSVQRHDDQVG